MKRKTIRRGLAALLCMAMLLSLPALAVFEEDEVQEIPVTSDMDALVELPEGKDKIELPSTDGNDGIQLFDTPDYWLCYHPNGGEWTSETINDYYLSGNKEPLGNWGIYGPETSPRLVEKYYPVREGYTLMGWSRNSESTVADIALGESPPYYGIEAVFATVYLYAVWQGKPCTLTYDANGGTGTPDSVACRVGDFVTLSTEVPAKGESIFLGWSSNPSATVGEYESGSQIKITGETTLYAIWQDQQMNVIVPTTVAIHMDASGGITCGNITITNNSSAAVMIKDTQVSALNGWTLMDYTTTTFTEANKGQHKVALKLSSLDGAISGNGGSKTIGVSAKIPRQGGQITNASIAQVVFVLGRTPPLISCDSQTYYPTYNNGVYTTTFTTQASVDPGRVVSILVSPASDWTGWSWTLTVSNSGGSKVIASGSGNPSERDWQYGVEVGWDYYGDPVSVTFEATEVFVWPDKLTGVFNPTDSAGTCDLLLEKVSDNIYQIVTPTGFSIKPYGVTITVTPPDGYKFVESTYNNLAAQGSETSGSAQQNISFSVQEDGTLSVYEGHGGYASEYYTWSGIPTVALEKV